MSFLTSRKLAIAGSVLAACFFVGSLAGQFTAAAGVSPANSFAKNRPQKQSQQETDAQRSSWWKWFLQVTHVEDAPAVPDNTFPPADVPSVVPSQEGQTESVGELPGVPNAVPVTPPPASCPPAFHCSNGADCDVSAMAVMPEEGAVSCALPNGGTGLCWKCLQDAPSGQPSPEPISDPEPALPPIQEMPPIIDPSSAAIPLPEVIVPQEQSSFEEAELPPPSPSSSESGETQEENVVGSTPEIPAPVPVAPTPPPAQAAQPPSDDCGPVPEKGAFCAEAKFWCGPAGHWYEVCLYPSS